MLRTRYELTAGFELAGVTDIQPTACELYGGVVMVFVKGVELMGVIGGYYPTEQIDFHLTYWQNIYSLHLDKLDYV